jgi:hypothetical protein
MSTSTQPLKYLFTAIYDDGSVFEQPENDRSKDHIEGAEWNPSSFRDVDQDSLRYFALKENPEDLLNCNYRVVVDLHTGLFYINGQWIQIHNQNDILGQLKLIYFREVKKELIDGVEQEAYVSKYFVGWETITGKKIKRTIGIE